MTNPNIRIKRSAVAGKRPEISQVDMGELALNTNDGRLFTRKYNVGIGSTVTLLNVWTENIGGGAYYNEGNIGIGTDNPTSKLTIIGDEFVSGILTASEIVASTANIETLDTTTAEIDFLTNTNLNTTGIATISNLNVDDGFDVYANASVFHQNVVIQGNLTVNGTEVILNVDEKYIKDKQIVLGFSTTNNVDDTTANGGGLGIASTEGSPLVCLQCTGINTLPSTYKQLIWTKANTFGAGTTDAFLFNYAVGIGSTLVPTGTRLAVGGIHFTDNNVTASTFTGSGANLTSLNASNISSGTLNNLRLPQNISVSGIITATTFVGNLTGTALTTTNIPNLSGDISSNNTVTTLATVNSNVGTFGGTGAIPVVTVNGKGLVTGVSTVAPNNGTLSLGVSGTGLSGSSSFTANQSGASTFTVTSNATSANTNNTIVARNGSGGFVAGVVTATSFVGPLSGTATSTTNIPNLTGAITSVNTTTSLGSFTSANLAAALTDETGSGANVFATSPTLVTPILGTPTSGTLTNCTGLPVSTGISGLGANVATFLATPSSSNLASAVTDETGTGVLVFATSPTLVTPVLGSASATSINVSGIVTATTFVGNITGNLNSSGVNTAATLSGTSLTYTTGSITNISGTNINYSGISTFLGNVNIGGTVSIGTAIDIVPYDTLNNGTLSFEGSAGQLFSITNNLTSGSIFSVNDVSGIPSIDVDADGTIQIGPYGGNLGVGTTNPTSKLTVIGDVLVSGIVTATTFVGPLSGTATSTTNIPNLTGDISSVNTTTTLATVNSNVGTFGGTGAIPVVTVNGKGLVTGISTVAPNNGTLTLAVSGTGLSGSASFTANQSGASTFTVTSNATSANTNNTIVARDGSGNFSAGTITANLTGTASNVTTNANLTGDVTSIGNATAIATGVIVNADINASAAIAVSKLAASTISGITLGNNLNTLTIGTGLSGSSYNGSSAVTIAIDSTVATLTGTQTLTNKTLTSPTLTTPVLGAATATSINASGAITANSYNVGTDVGISTTRTTVATTAATTIDSFAIATFRSARVQVQITQGTNYQTSDVLIIHNGTTANIVEYGSIATNDYLGTFSSTVSGGNCLLQINMSSATSSTVKVLSQRITV
jgi:hypothetical protein